MSLKKGIFFTIEKSAACSLQNILQPGSFFMHRISKQFSLTVETLLQIKLSHEKWYTF